MDSFLLVTRNLQRFYKNVSMHAYCILSSSEYKTLSKQLTPWGFQQKLISNLVIISNPMGKNLKSKLWTPIFFCRPHGEMVEILIGNPLFSLEMTHILISKLLFPQTPLKILWKLSPLCKYCAQPLWENQQPGHNKGPHGENVSKKISDPVIIRPTPWGFGQKKNQRPGSYNRNWKVDKWLQLHM